ncbi:rhomboid-like protein [Brachybacterium sp. AOP25-B2-12]|uniref:rhomboid-like protein n=1 Tax=Brachybacterium sp. AOP25-B2-12 TaxID=3457710 RepID=UPI004034020E
MIRHALAILLLVGALVLVLSLVTDGRATAPLSRAWQRYGASVRWYVASAPATFAYLAVLTVTTWVLLGMPEVPLEAFLTAQSTNLAHLTTDPVRVLIRSAFFVTRTELLVWIVAFSAFVAPVERWLGSARTIGVFALGHLGATAVTALDIYLHIRFLHAPASLWTVTDTGASYGFFALAAVLVHRVRGISRVLLVAGLAGVVVYGVIEGTGYTARGHAIAVVIGVLVGLLLARSPHVHAREGAGRSLWSLWRPATADRRRADPGAVLEGPTPLQDSGAWPTTRS